MIMGFKFTLQPRIRGFIEWQLEHYREDKRQLEDYKASLMPSMTVNYDKVNVAGGGEGRQTEETAMRIVLSQELRLLELSCNAIERALKKCDETDLKLIELVYWKQTFNITGAGMQLGLTKSPAYRRINRILTLIAMEMGLIGV